ncbi:MAG: SDR family NAD(P)-dependent oxidoreductase [Myxococcota bacterium]
MSTKLVDNLLEVPIAPSFTRIGSVVRSRTEGWTDLDDYDLTDRTIVITGATSGLGLAAAHRLAGLGATLVVVGRNPAKTDAAVAALASPTGAEHAACYADMAELDAVNALADTILDEHESVDTLIHNAGALLAERTENAAGIEVTVASQVLGPFLLTARLLPALGANSPSRVLTMSSGGMYSAPLTVNRLQMSGPESPNPYNGTEQYARAKRAQVTLNEIWAQKFPDSGVRFHSLHPGWADTPGVEEALPTFRKIVGPLLRSPDEGADTLVWLAADDTAILENGGFWHDRARRSIHRLPRTRQRDTDRRRADLWSWCVDQSGIDPEG